MKVAIIGYGFVGKAIEFGTKKNVEIIKIDPKLGTDISELIDFKPDICFICVPTPMNNDGSQDIDILENVINDLLTNSIKSLFILKMKYLDQTII